MDRKALLARAEECVCGSREQDYGRPEDSFDVIAAFWETYLGAIGMGKGCDKALDGCDVANMMTLLKIARNATGHGKDDNWVDIAGYAACGAEIQSRIEAARVRNSTGAVKATDLGEGVSYGAFNI